MSRSDTRNGTSRSIQDTRPTGRSLVPDGLKRDARQFLNSAEYEFRKVVGASRTVPSPPESSPVQTRETTPKRKQGAPLTEAERT